MNTILVLLLLATVCLFVCLFICLFVCRVAMLVVLGTLKPLKRPQKPVFSRFESLETILELLR